MDEEDTRPVYILASRAQALDRVQELIQPDMVPGFTRRCRHKSSGTQSLRQPTHLHRWLADVAFREA